MRHTGTTHSTLLPCAFLALLGGCTSAGSSLQNRFAAVHNTLHSMGLSQVGHISEGSLAEGATQRFAINLEAQCYSFVAFGGNGARDIDLTVLDSSNNRVGNDDAHDTQAAVRFCAPARGRYTLAVRMASGGGSFLLANWRGGAASSGGSDSADGPGTCRQPLPIAIGQTVSGNTTRAASEQSGSCLPGGDDDNGGGGAPELVYALTVERRQLVTVSVEQSGNYDGAVYLRAGTCEDPGAEVPQSCNDDFGDVSHSRVSVPLEPGQYFIFVDGYGRNRGQFAMTVTARDVPSLAEVCQNAATLTPNTPVTGQLSTQDLNLFTARCGGGGRGPDRPYRLDVPQESRVQIHQESDYDGVIYVRRACGDAASEVACNDDAEDVQHARINTVLTAGTYYVFTDAYPPQAQGNYTLQADLAPIAGGNTPGDTCADAQPLTPGTPIEGNTLQAHDDLHPTCAAPQDGYDVVYRLDVPNRSRVKVWLDSADLRTSATLTLARDCAQLAQATCRPGAVGEQRGIDEVLAAGRYYIIVDSSTPRAFGRFRINSRIENVQEIERLCRTAPLLVPGRTVTGTTSGTDRFQASCAGGARSPENLYRLVLRRRSHVRLALSSTTPGYDAALYIRQNCTSPSSERACNDDAGDPQHSLIETDLDAGTYTVFVDGYSNRNSGSYSLETQVSPR